MIPRIINDNIVIQDNDKLHAVFPDLKQCQINGQKFCAVPHTLESSVVLNNMGISAPSPIRTQYDWPGQYTPKTHQVHTAEFLTLNRRAFCLNGMGSMKTLSSLWAADYLQSIGKVDKVLVIAPLSTLDPTWGAEIFRNFPFKRYAILHGSRQKRLDLLEDDYDIYIINHDGIGIIQKELTVRKDIDLFILDEQACYRNQRSKRWKIINDIINKSNVVRSVWGLTGAPTPNEPTDAYAQARLVRPENCKGHFTAFKHKTMFQVSQWRWVPKKNAENDVNDLLQPSIRYALEDCVDLPPTIHTCHKAPLSPAQSKHYKNLLRQAMTTVDGTTVTAVNAAVLVNKIIQAALGVMIGVDGSLAKIDFKPRIKVVKELVEGCNQKVIVFVPLTGALNAVASELRKSWSVAVVDGSVSVAKRNKIFQQFRDTKDPHIIVANAGAMSHGLNLTEASLIVWYAPVTSHDTYVQANARIARPGQKHTTQIAHIYATPEEKRIYRVLKEKGRLQDLVLKMAEEGR